MKAHLFVKYSGTTENNESEIVLSDLGESLIAVNNLIEELGNVLRIQTQIEIYATTHREGSHIVDLLLRINDQFQSLPFDTTQNLIEFLKIASNDLCLKANEYFSDLQDLHKKVNDFGAKYPVDLALLAGLIPFLFTIINKIRSNDHSIYDKISERIAKGIIKLIDKNYFGKIATPIVMESAKSIEISTDHNFKHNNAIINKNNFEDLMGKDTEILSHLINGLEVSITGEVKSLKSTRGDSLTIHIDEKDNSYNIDVEPQEGKTTKNYIQFYQETVNIRGVVERTSMFKRPKIKMIDINLIQTKLDLQNK